MSSRSGCEGTDQAGTGDEVAVNRKDWTLGNWHLIRRTAQTTQYGWLLWSLHGEHTLDVWLRRTLWTLRRLP